MQDIINEIRKLIEYAGENGIITKEEIDKLCTKKIDSVIFDLTDNLGKKNIKQALEVLNNLIYEKEPVPKILITLYNHFKKIYLVKLAIKWNKRIEEAINLKPNQTFLISKYKTQANYFKEEELRTILEELINLDSNYKVGLIDINIGLEAILCKYCS
jgi:DNA polymerase-3 subunit delta